MKRIFFKILTGKTTYFFSIIILRLTGVAGQFTSGVDFISRQKWGFYLQYLHTRHIASNFDCNPLLMKP